MTGGRARRRAGQKVSSGGMGGEWGGVQPIKFRPIFSIPLPHFQRKGQTNLLGSEFARPQADKLIDSGR